jgi:hypothetical protein
MTGLGTGPHTGNGLDHNGRFAIIPEWLWPRLPELTKTEVLVLIIIIGWSKDSWRAAKRRSAPSLRDIADILGIRRQEVRRATHGLQAKGLLEMHNHTTRRGSFNSTIYDLAGGVSAPQRTGCPLHSVQVSAELRTRQRRREDFKERGGPPVVPLEQGDAAAAPPPLGGMSKEQADDRPTRRRQQVAAPGRGNPVCTIAEWQPTERDYQAALDQGRAAGWLGAHPDAAVNREFAQFRQWAIDNKLEPRSPAKWSATWRSWLAKGARSPQRRPGQQRGRRSIADSVRRTAGWPNRRPLEADPG